LNINSTDKTFGGVNQMGVGQSEGGLAGGGNLDSIGDHNVGDSTRFGGGIFLEGSKGMLFATVGDFSAFVEARCGTCVDGVVTSDSIEAAVVLGILGKADQSSLAVFDTIIVDVEVVVVGVGASAVETSSGFGTENESIIVEA